MARLNEANCELMLEATKQVRHLTERATGQEIAGVKAMGRALSRFNRDLNQGLAAAFVGLNESGFTRESLEADDNFDVFSFADDIQQFAKTCQHINHDATQKQLHSERTYAVSAKQAVIEILQTKPSEIKQDRAVRTIEKLALQLAETFKIRTARVWRERPIANIKQDVCNLLEKEVAGVPVTVGKSNSESVLKKTLDVITLFEACEATCESDAQQVYWRALADEVNMAVKPMLQRLAQQKAEVVHLLHRAFQTRAEVERLKSLPDTRDNHQALARARSEDIATIALKQRALASTQQLQQRMFDMEQDANRRTFGIVWQHVLVAHQKGDEALQQNLLEVLKNNFDLNIQRSFSAIKRSVEKSDWLLPTHTSFKNIWLKRYDNFLNRLRGAQRDGADGELANVYKQSRRKLPSSKTFEWLWTVHYEALVKMLQEANTAELKQEISDVLQKFHQHRGRGLSLYSALRRHSAHLNNDAVRRCVQNFCDGSQAHTMTQYQSWVNTLTLMIENPDKLMRSKAWTRKRFANPVSEHLFGILRIIALLSGDTTAAMRSYLRLLQVEGIDEQHPDAPRLAYISMQRFYRDVLLGAFIQIRDMDLHTLRMHFPGDSQKDRLVAEAKHTLERLRREMGFQYGLEKSARTGRYEVALKRDVLRSEDKHRKVKQTLQKHSVIPVLLMAIGQGSIAAAGVLPLILKLVAVGSPAMWILFIFGALCSTGMNYIFMYNDTWGTLYNIYRKDETGRSRLFSGLSKNKTRAMYGAFIFSFAAAGTVAFFATSQVVSIFAIVMTGGAATAFGATAIIGGTAMLVPPVGIVVFAGIIGLLTLIGMFAMTYAGIGGLIRKFKGRSLRKFLRRLIDIAGYKAYCKDVDDRQLVVAPGQTHAQARRLFEHEKRHLKRRKLIATIFKPIVFGVITLGLVVANFVSFFTFQKGAYGLFNDPANLLMRAERGATIISWVFTGVGVPVTTIFNVSAAATVADVATHVASRGVARFFKRFFTAEGRENARKRREIHKLAPKESFKNKLPWIRFVFKKVLLWIGTLVNGFQNGAAMAPKSSKGVQLLGGNAAYIPALVAGGMGSMTLGAIYSHGEVLVKDLLPLPLNVAPEVPEEVVDATVAAKVGTVQVRAKVPESQHFEKKPMRVFTVDQVSRWVSLAEQALFKKSLAARRRSSSGLHSPQHRPSMQPRVGRRSSIAVRG